MSLVIQPDMAPLRIDSHGVCRVSGTRVSLEVLIHAFQRGATAEEIAQRFPSVPLSDVYATIAYYLKHREDVERYLQQAEEEEERALREVRSRFPLTDLRERLLAGRKLCSNGPLSIGAFY